MLSGSAAEVPGVDFEHHARALGHRKVARVVAPRGEPPDGGWPVAYLLHSFGGDRRSWARCAEPFSPELGDGRLYVLPESGRRWFINDVSGKRYEDYLVNDLVPAIESAFPVRRTAQARLIGGFSMGGAAAVQLSLLYPEVFSRSFAVSGAFYASERQGDPYAEHRATASCMMPTEDEHNRVWGPPGSAVRRRYDLDALIDRVAVTRRFPRMALIVGTDDFSRVVAQNRRMHGRLEAIGLEHAYAERPGDHTWRFAAPAAAWALEQLAH